MSAPVTNAFPVNGSDMMPRFVLEPIATEALIEAAPASINPARLYASVLALFAAHDDSPSALLARVADSAGRVIHEWPYAMRSWCVESWNRSTLQQESQCPRMRPTDSPPAADTGRRAEHRFALPPVRRVALEPLLAGALLYGGPGVCPAVFSKRVWEDIGRIFRWALPNEALVTLLGSLCQDPKSGRMFTLVDEASAVSARSGPSSVLGSACQVADAVSEGSNGMLVGIAHSHPADKAISRVVISETDFETFRLRLRSAHMISLIANASPDGPIEAILLSWLRGGAVPAGFYVAGEQ